MMEKWKDVTMFVCGLLVGLAVGYSLAPHSVKGNNVPAALRSSDTGQPEARTYAVVPLKRALSGNAYDAGVVRGKICTWQVEVGETADMKVRGYASYQEVSGYHVDADGKDRYFTVERSRP